MTVAGAGRRHDVVVVGESLGLLVAERTGRLMNGAGMRLGFGGAESNVAIGVARLGGRGAWIGRVGDDAVGAMIVRELRAEGLAAHPIVDPDASTAIMLKERPQPGATRITYYRRGQAGSRLAPDDIPADPIRDARVLHVTGISAGLGEGPLAAVHRAIDVAKDAGTLVSFDVNHRSRLWDDLDAAREAYRGLAARADILFAGDDEAELLTGARAPEDQLAAMLGLGAQHAVLKLGERGAVAATAGGAAIGRAAVRVPVVDTVGAGDAFVAGWLVEALAGSDEGARLDIAVACGAAACTADGDWEAAPTRADLARLGAPGADPVAR